MSALNRTNNRYRVAIESESESITGQAAIADLSRGTAQVYNYKKELASYKYWFKLL